MFSGLRRFLRTGLAAVLSAAVLSAPTAVFAEEADLIDQNEDGVIDVFDYVLSKRTAVTENSPVSLTFSDAEGTAGSVVMITVSVSQNTGFSTSRILIGFDPELKVYTPDGADSCVLPDRSAFPDMYVMPFVVKRMNRISCYTELKRYSEKNGVLYDLCFQLPEDAEPGATYSVWYEDAELLDNGARLPVLTNRGEIKVVSPETTKPPVITTKPKTTVSVTTYTETVTEAKPTTKTTKQTTTTKPVKTETTSAAVTTTVTTTEETTTTTVRTARPYLWKGIDVSQYQGDIDFEKVRDESENKFVMMRAGFGRELDQEDLKFRQNYANATKAGIPVGAYWYSYADSPERARVEAHVCAQVLGNRKFEYPIAFDIEEPNVLAMEPEKIGAIIEAFCSEMESMGYYAMLYCSSYYLNNRIPWQTISKYTVWVANYNVEYPSYYGDYGIWQYGIGTSAGIEGDVDVNYCYKDYEKIIKGCHRNGF